MSALFLWRQRSEKVTSNALPVCFLLSAAHFPHRAASRSLKSVFWHANAGGRGCGERSPCRYVSLSRRWRTVSTKGGGDYFLKDSVFGRLSKTVTRVKVQVCRDGAWMWCECFHRWNQGDLVPAVRLRCSRLIQIYFIKKTPSHNSAFNVSFCRLVCVAAVFLGGGHQC